MELGDLAEVTADRYYVIAKRTADGEILYLSPHYYGPKSEVWKPDWGKDIPYRTVNNQFLFDDKEMAIAVMNQRRFSIVDSKWWSYAEQGAFVVEVELRMSVTSVC